MKSVRKSSPLVQFEPNLTGVAVHKGMLLTIYFFMKIIVLSIFVEYLI